MYVGIEPFTAAEMICISAISESSPSRVGRGPFTTYCGASIMIEVIRMLESHFTMSVDFVQQAVPAGILKLGKEALKESQSVAELLYKSRMTSKT